MSDGLTTMPSNYDTFFRAIPADWYDSFDGEMGFRLFGIVTLDHTGLLDEIGNLADMGYDIPEFDGSVYFVNLYDNGEVWAFKADSFHDAVSQYESDEYGYKEFLAALDRGDDF